MSQSFNMKQYETTTIKPEKRFNRNIVTERAQLVEIVERKRRGSLKISIFADVTCNTTLIDMTIFKNQNEVFDGQETTKVSRLPRNDVSNKKSHMLAQNNTHFNYSYCYSLPHVTHGETSQRREFLERFNTQRFSWNQIDYGRVTRLDSFRIFFGGFT